MRKKWNLQLFADGGEGGADGAGNESNAGNNGNGGQKNAGASYSYEQVEEMANARVRRAEQAALKSYFQQQGMTEAETAAAIADYKKRKANEKPDITAIEQARDQALSELADLKNANLLRDKGVKQEDMDYVMFKVKQNVTDKVDFQKAAEAFLKENPRFASAQPSYRFAGGTQPSGTGGKETANDRINAAIRRAAGIV